MDQTLALTLGVFFVLFFATASFGLYLWLNKDDYTREKFAFAGLSAGATLTAFVGAAIVADEPPWLMLIGFIKQLSGISYQPPQALSIEQEILSFGLVVILWLVIAHLHKHWDGAESVNQYEQRQKQETPSLLADLRLLLSRNRELLAVYDPAQRYRLTALEGVDASPIWREQARELLQLSDDKYDFPDDGWHEAQHCWIGTHNGTGETVVLACHDTAPDAAALRELADYAKKACRHQGRNGHSLRFILALKEGDADTHFKVQGQPLRAVSESRLLDTLVNFDNYYRDLRRRVEKDPLTGSDLTLEQVYTLSRYKLEKHGTAYPDVEGFLNQWLDESSRRQIALLGEYGQGKSTTSLLFSYHLMQRQHANPRAARIPILLELRGKSPRNLRADELLSTWAFRFGVDTRALIKLLVAGRLLLIFEGFDEVDLSGDADARIEHFRTLWELCYPKAKIIVTGRPNYFLDEAELKAALGIQASSLERPYCQAIYLAPFGTEEMAFSLRNLRPNTRDGILELAGKNERFHDIVSRPSMLHVVGVLWETENLTQYGERINSAVVMDVFVRHSLERQDGKGKKPAFMALNSHERAYFMEGIAVYMLVNQLSNQITGRQLEEVVRLLFGIIPDAVSMQTDALSGNSRKPLRQRYDLKSNPDALSSVLTDVRACGLLVSDVSRSGSFKFGHKSFMEFMAAKVFAQWSFKKELQEVEEKKVFSLVNALKLKMKHVVQHYEVMAFSVEWIAGKAANRNDAVGFVFLMLFRQCNAISISIGVVSKLFIRCLPYTKDSSFMLVAAKIFKRITSFTFLVVEKQKEHPVFLIALFVSFVVTNILRFSISERQGHMFANVYFFEWIVGIIVGFSFVFMEIYFQFYLGYNKIQVSPLWVKFRSWQAICFAAHLDRSAMAKVVGEKALQLLEEVAQQEPKPWTIAESLEKLRANEKPRL